MVPGADYRGGGVITLKEFEYMLVEHELIDEDAVLDPEGYDLGTTKDRIKALYTELRKAVVE